MPALDCAHCGATSQDPTGWVVAAVTMIPARPAGDPPVETVAQEVLCPRCAEAARNMLKEDANAAVC